jgi:hypothetical protein
MNRVRVSRLLLVSLVVLFVPAFASPAFAVPPTFQTFNLAFTIPVTGCAFPVELTIAGTVKVSIHTDSNGKFVMEIDRIIHGSATLTNPITGKSVSSVNAGPNLDRGELGGAFTVVGVVVNITVPGHGTVFLEVGRLFFNPATGEIFFEAGKHATLTGASEEFCALLADP